MQQENSKTNTRIIRKPAANFFHLQCSQQALRLPVITVYCESSVGIIVDPALVPDFRVGSVDGLIPDVAHLHHGVGEGAVPVSIVLGEGIHHLPGVGRGVERGRRAS